MKNVISKNQVIFAMSKDNTPVYNAKPKETLIFETEDCFKGQIGKDNLHFDGVDWNSINPATGPVYIEGAEVGDLLSVHIQNIEAASHALVVTGPGLGVLGDTLKDNIIKWMDILDDKLIFSDLHQLPINKMVGVIGVAPATDPILCGTPDSHGGNMDCKEIKEGSTIFLPVQVAGGLLALGDCHAAMGDGEVGVSGAEMAARVTVVVDVIKQVSMQHPFVLANDNVYTLASAKTLDEAAELATTSMIQLLTQYENIDLGEAIMLLSLVGQLQVCQIVDPNKTARMCLSTQYLPEFLKKLK